MAMSSFSEYWSAVGKIVKARGHSLKRYKFFEDVWEALDDGKNVILIAPTGCGKTEATTVPFLYNLINGNRQAFSLVYTLPARSLASNMYDRLCKSLRILESKDIVCNIDYGEFLEFKPYLEGDVVVTTYDTLFYTFYGFRRLGFHVLLHTGKIAGSYIIFDEAQLLQDNFWYSLSLLPKHIRALCKWRAQIVVMTATLPDVLLKELNKFMKNNVEVIFAEDKPSRGKLSVTIMNSKIPINGEELLKLISGELPALIVVNTVSKAVKIYKSLYNCVHGKGIDLLLLHSRLRLGVRKEREKFFERNKKDNIIVIATQVVEAGLDYHFKTLLTELSPIDSLIQRLGRCARKSDGKAYVFINLDKDSKKIYPDNILNISKETILRYQDILCESVRNVFIASKLVNEVYTERVINELTKPVMKEINNVSIFIDNFYEYIFKGRFDKDLNLLRLGFEIICWYASENIFKRLIKGETVECSIEDFRDNIVRLSCMLNMNNKNIRLPKAVLINIEGNECLLLLETNFMQEKVYLRVKEKISKNNFRFLEAKSRYPRIFLLNPHFYERNTYGDLGVISLWRPASYVS